MSKNNKRGHKNRNSHHQQQQQQQQRQQSNRQQQQNETQSHSQSQQPYQDEAKNKSRILDNDDDVAQRRVRNSTAPTQDTQTLLASHSYGRNYNSFDANNEMMNQPKQIERDQVANTNQNNNNNNNQRSQDEEVCGIQTNKKKIVTSGKEYNFRHNSDRTQAQLEHDENFHRPPARCDVPDDLE